jgi:phosphoribosylformylglycinamidine cyclo-ligase
VVDDLVVVGAEPLFLTDYIATGKVVPDKIAAIVAGIAEGCVQAGCALVGGETAEHPGLMAPDEYDVSGTGVGVVNADAVLGPHRVRAGDVLIAMGSSGLHSNGYSLVRHVLLDRAGLNLAGVHPELGGRTLAEELLVPTRVYARDCLALAAQCDAHAFAHVTGGGLAANLARVLPESVQARVDRTTWAPPPIFDLVARTGGVPLPEMELTFNLGVGMVAVLPAAAAEDALALLAQRGVPAWIAGELAPRPSAPGGARAEPQGTPAVAGAVGLVGAYLGPAADW